MRRLCYVTARLRYEFSKKFGTTYGTFRGIEFIARLLERYNVNETKDILEVVKQVGIEFESRLCDDASASVIMVGF